MNLEAWDIHVVDRHRIIEGGKLHDQAVCRFGMVGFRVHVEVAHPAFSAMVVANVECGVPGISPGSVTDPGDRVADFRARILCASIFETIGGGWSQHRASVLDGRSIRLLIDPKQTPASRNRAATCQ
jgi:hypothetical protein